MILDSNIVIYAFQPEYRESNLERFLLQGEFSVSNVTRLEVMGYWRNSDDEFNRFGLFFEAIHVLAVSSEIIDCAIQLRRQRSMGLGDAIIAATGLAHQLPLVTHNIRDFQWIEQLELIDPLVAV
ncbi:MAG: type II toxin-antitoxin system VapC family toxin [Methylobacter sp.]